MFDENKAGSFADSEGKTGFTPAMSELLKLISRSKERGNTRDTFSGPDCTVTNMQTGESFKISVIRETEDARLRAVQQMMEDTFDPTEVDTFETLSESVEIGEDPTIEISGYKIICVYNGEGELVALTTGGHLKMLDDKDEPTEVSAYVRCYSICRPEYRQSGLVREAYISAFIDCINESRESGLDFRYVVSEAVSSSEPYQNATNLKRIYVQAGDKHTYREVAYVQPPLDYDSDTGLPAEGAGPAAEHLMVRRFDGKTPRREDLISLVRTMIVWNALLPKDEFSSTEAYESHRALVKGYMDQFADSLGAAESNVILLSAKDRIKARNKNILVDDYTDAD
jgi:hypothetical protein